MSAVKINQWINSLGQDYTAFLAAGLIPNQPLIELFPGADDLYLEPEPGLYMRFLATTKYYKSLSITLRNTTPLDIIYEGELPKPYTKYMSQDNVRALFGEPLESSGPIRMPEPLGQTGGWEAYHLDTDTYPNIKVLFQYNESMQVDTLVFRLINENLD